MRIVAPISKPHEIEKLIEAGANELYCGVVDRQWRRRYSLVSSVNLRHDRAANLGSFKELERAVQAAHACSANIFLVLNAHFYSKRQLSAVLKQTEKAIKAEIDALIVSDAALIAEIKRELTINVFLSTGNPVFNANALEFFKGLGVSRVVLPRHLTISEIAKIVKRAKGLGLAIECFVLNVMCPFIDGLCTFQHVVDESVSFLPIGGLPCRARFKAKALAKTSNAKRLAAEAHVELWSNTHARDCGLCALPYFHRFGVESVKIAGRAHSLEKKLADVRAVKKALDFIKGPSINAGKGNAFRELCRELYFNLFYNKCDYINCYYHEAGFK